MAWKWLCQLQDKYPELAERAKAMNQRDGFVMKYDPVEIERREREEREEKERKDERKRRKQMEQSHSRLTWEPKMNKEAKMADSFPEDDNGVKRSRVESHPTVSPEA